MYNPHENHNVDENIIITQTQFIISIHLWVGKTHRLHMVLRSASQIQSDLLSTFRLHRLKHVRIRIHSQYPHTHGLASLYRNVRVLITEQMFPKSRPGKKFESALFSTERFISKQRYDDTQFLVPVRKTWELLSIRMGFFFRKRKYCRRILNIEYKTAMVLKPPCSYRVVD